jgi:GTP cyclohydrolase I
MKQNETLSNIHLKDGKIILTEEEIDAAGDNHISTSVDTPMRAGAFDQSEDEKIAAIEERFAEIMDILGLDLTDDSLRGTPKRVAKMYVKEIFNGLNPANKPKMALFENKYKYNEMLVEKNISFYSNCEHHFVPIMGKAHIAYISNGTVVGLSKLNRLVDYFAKRPQVLVGWPSGRDIWNLNGARNFFARLIWDAGGEYFWHDDLSLSLVPVNFETVYDQQPPARFWFSRSFSASTRQQLAP